MTDSNSQMEQELERLRKTQAIYWRAVTHELRTPLQALVGFVEMLEPGLPFDKLVQYQQIIVRETDRLARVVEELQQQVELESGELAFNAAPIALDELQHAAARDCELWAPDCIVVMEHPDDELPLALADPARARQVLDSLLRNAVRYSPEEAVVYLRPIFHPKTGRVEIQVRDEGAGIPSEFQTVIFERFAKLPATQAGKSRWGLGMGLYVAREIARHMGGDVNLGETGETGSTFSFSLPIAEKASR